MRAIVLAVMMCWALQTAAAAQGQHARPHLPEMAVVVESQGGIKLARKVRAMLANETRVRAQPLGSFTERGVEPDVVVTVSLTIDKGIQVMYWDRTGVADALDTALPKALASRTVVAASLALALVRKNLPALREAMRTDPEHHIHFGRSRARRALATLSLAELRGLFASIGAVAHRTEGLTEADF